jgi:hypothetical protein
MTEFFGFPAVGQRVNPLAESMERTRSPELLHNSHNLPMLSALAGTLDLESGIIPSLSTNIQTLPFTNGSYWLPLFRAKRPTTNYSLAGIDCAD